jgi:vacuolar iron transporter family protein
MTRPAPASAEPHGGGMATRLNWLRAAVLGANDGIVSTAGLVVGVAGASSSRTAVLTAGLAGLLAGSLAITLVPAPARSPWA